MKGDWNEEICQNQPFCAFRTIALPTDRQTDRPTDMTSYRSARTHLKMLDFDVFNECVTNQPTDQRTQPIIEMRGRIQKQNNEDIQNTEMLISLW